MGTWGLGHLQRSAGSAGPYWAILIRGLEFHSYCLTLFGVNVSQCWTSQGLAFSPAVVSCTEDLADILTNPSDHGKRRRVCHWVWDFNQSHMEAKSVNLGFPGVAAQFIQWRLRESQGDCLLQRDPRTAIKSRGELELKSLSITRGPRGLVELLPEGAIPSF